MAKLLSALLFIVNLCLHCTISYGRTYTEVYSWRDFYGVIPHDSIVAGFDENHYALYMGQVLYEDKIIAGKIIEGEKSIHIEYFNKEYILGKNIKILCTHQPEKLDWIPTNKTEMFNLAIENTLIRGGYEKGCFTYIGRLPPVNDMTNVGKIMCCTEATECYGLYTTNNGTGQLNEVFDVLSYVEDKVNTVIKVSTSSKDQKDKRVSIDVIFN